MEEEKNRDRILSMQVESTMPTVPMQVQRRERDRSEKFGNGVGYKFVESRSDDEGESNSSSNNRQLGSWAELFSSKSSSILEFLTNNPPKLIFVAVICASVLLLLLLMRQSGGASLCKANGTEAMSYPNVRFDKVKLLKDKARFAAVKAENWIVLSVADHPTDEVQGMVKLQGWQVLAIGDSETPSDWLVPGAIFLSTELQATFGYRVASLMPYSSYVRKNIGYLFAIQHGAVRIYDADDHSSFIGGHLGRSFDIDSKKKLLQFKALKNRTVVNPFVHFGQRSVWPRGLPLTSVPKISSEMTYSEVSGDGQYIRQALANGLPDVDAVFYHSRRLAGEPINIEFDHLAPAVALPQGTMAPVNSINTLFEAPAFWALMLPVSVRAGISDILRGYWSQRLLWEIGGKVALYPPSIRRTDRMEGAVFDDEEDLLQDWDRLLDFLISWRSSKRSLFEKILDLSYSMAKNDFWSSQDLELTVAWLQDLVAVGYKPPKLGGLEIDEVNNVSSGHHKTRQFLPQVFKSIYPGVDDASSVEKEMGHLIRWRGFYDDIVLILECEWPTNHTTAAWRMLYGRLFKHVVLLSQGSDATLGVEAGGGWQAYASFPGIFDRYPDAKGFLYAKDHVVLNYWNIMSANKSKLWTMHNQEKEAWNRVSFNDTGSLWYLKSSIKRTVKKAIYNLPDKLRATYRKSMDDNYFIHSTSDFFYLPQRFVGDFKDLTSLGVQHHVAHELAIPVFLLAMDEPSQFDSKAFSQVARVEWAQDAAAAAAARYSIDLHVLYPWKATSEADVFRIIRSMSAGDHLLLAAWQ